MTEQPQKYLNQDFQQILFQGNYSFPFTLKSIGQSCMTDSSPVTHTQGEIVFLLLSAGQLDVTIGQDSCTLQAGDGLFCSPGCLSVCTSREYGCLYALFSFSPRLLYGCLGSFMDIKYVPPLLSDPQTKFLRLSKNRNPDILKNLKKIYLLCTQTEKNQDLEYQILRFLEDGWLHLCQYAPGKSEVAAMPDATFPRRLEAILTYIHLHYTETLTLDSISSQAGLSVSECCRFFKKYMKVSVFHYLLEYRIRQSLPLLLDGRHNITETASSVGFSSSSYYAQIFKRYMGVTPKAFRLQHISSSSEAKNS